VDLARQHLSLLVLFVPRSIEVYGSHALEDSDTVCCCGMLRRACLQAHPAGVAWRGGVVLACGNRDTVSFVGQCDVVGGGRKSVWSTNQKQGVWSML
jgi:hypothetical protein